MAMIILHCKDCVCVFLFVENSIDTKIISITNLTEKDYYVLKLYDSPNTCMYMNV